MFSFIGILSLCVDVVALDGMLLLLLSGRYQFALKSQYALSVAVFAHIGVSYWELNFSCCFEITCFLGEESILYPSCLVSTF